MNTQFTPRSIRMLEKLAAKHGLEFDTADMERDTGTQELVSLDSDHMGQVMQCLPVPRTWFITCELYDAIGYVVLHCRRDERYEVEIISETTHARFDQAYAAMRSIVEIEKGTL